MTKGKKQKTKDFLMITGTDYSKLKPSEIPEEDYSNWIAEETEEYGEGMKKNEVNK